MGIQFPGQGTSSRRHLRSCTRASSGIGQICTTNDSADNANTLYSNADAAKPSFSAAMYLHCDACFSVGSPTIVWQRPGPTRLRGTYPSSQSQSSPSWGPPLSPAWLMYLVVKRTTVESLHISSASGRGLIYVPKSGTSLPPQPLPSIGSPTPVQYRPRTRGQGSEGLLFSPSHVKTGR